MSHFDILKKIILSFIIILSLLFFYVDIYTTQLFWYYLSNFKILENLYNNIFFLKYHFMILIIVLLILYFYKSKYSFDFIISERNNELWVENTKKEIFESKYKRLNSIPFLWYILKNIYKEWKNYVIILLTIILLWLLLKILLSLWLSPENDETYTYMVIEWYNKLKIIWITPSGEMYFYSHKIFHFVSAIFYNFFYDLWFNKLFALRSLNIFLSSILVIPLYIFFKTISNKKIALLSIWIITFNWYILISSITARPYVVFMFFSVISTILFILWTNKIIEIWKINKKSIYYFTIWIILCLINFYEWHILWLYHNFIAIWILFLYILKNLKRKDSIKIIWFWVWLFILFFLFLYFFKYNFFIYIIKTFSPYFQFNHLSIAFSQFSYFTFLWWVIIVFFLSFIINGNNINYKLLVLYIIFTGVFFQAYLFWYRFNNFKYIVNLLVILLFIFSIFLYTYKNNKVKIIIILLFIFTNIYWFIKIMNDKIAWWVLYHENSITAYNLCWDNDIIATDSPGRAFLLYWYSRKIYSLPSYNDVYHHTNNEKYLYLDVYPFKNIEELKQINEGNNICFVFTHNMLNRDGKFWNDDLFNYVMDNWEILFKNDLYYRPFGSGFYPFSNKNNGIVIRFTQK